MLDSMRKLPLVGRCVASRVGIRLPFPAPHMRAAEAASPGRPWLLPLLGLLVLASVGPATGQTAAPAIARGEAEGVRILRERATAYWQARVARSERVLDFYAPPKEGRPNARARVSEGGAVRFIAFEIEGVEVRGDEADVRLRVEASVPMARHSRAARTASFSETWERVDGVWYKRPVPPGLARGGDVRAQVAGSAQSP